MAQWTEEATRLKDSQTDLNAWSAAKDFEFWATKIADAKHGSDQWWAIMHKLADDLRTLGAEQKAELDKQAKQQETINKNISAMVKIDSESQMKMAKEKYDTQYALGQISASQRAQLEVAADQKSYDAARAAYYKQLAALQETGEALRAKQSAIYEQMEKLQQEYLQKTQKANDQALIAMKNQWDGYATQVGSALTGMLFHHQTMLQTMRSLEEKFFSYVIDTLLKKMVNAWLASEAEKNVATQTGVATRTAAETAGSATSLFTLAANAIKAIMTDAAQVFAGIFAFLAPIMGPAAAGPAAAGQAAVEGVSIAAAGGWDVPANSFAMLHAREMVLPANLAERVRNMTDQGAGMGGGNSHFEMNRTQFNFHGDHWEEAIRRNPKVLYKAIRDGVKRGNLRWR